MTWLWWLMLGVVVGLIGMAPITRMLLRRAELRARTAERRARQTERMAELGSMTSGLAHEIKNPLSTVGLNAQLLAEAVDDSALDPEEKQRLRRRIDALSREVDRLGGILTDFLQYAGRMQLDARPHDLVELVAQLSDFFHPQCDQHGVTLRTQLPDEPVEAEIDEGLFKQALLNLMINAVQAMTPSDGNASDGAPARELMLRVQDEGDAARVHVIDTGPGIEPDKLEQIFHPYVSGKRGGTGLGLPTAQRIILEHSGRIEAHSEPGRGSNFAIVIPRRQIPQSRAVG